MSADIPKGFVSVGFDSHKDQHTMAIRGPDGWPVGHKVEIRNTKADFQLARDLINDAKAKTGAQGVRIGIEAASFYHLPLVSEMAPYYEDTRVYNPKLMGGRPRREVRQKKNDHKDADKIALAVRENVQGSMPYDDLPLMEIQELCRFLSRMLKDRTNLKKRYLRNLHMLFPGYDDLVGEVFKSCRTRMLSKYPSAEMVRNADVQELKATTQRNGRWGMRKKTVESIVDLANSVPDCPYYREALLIEQEMLLKRIRTLDHQIGKVSGRISTKWREMDIHPKYFQIEGLNPEYAISLYTEVRDLTRFPTVDKFVGFLGLDPWTRRSDKKVTYGRLTKMGSRYAREALGNAVGSMQNTNSVIRDCWKRAKERGRKSKECRVICMRKLARMMWGIENYQKNG
jgi:transposase